MTDYHAGGQPNPYRRGQEGWQRISLSKRMAYKKRKGDVGDKTPLESAQNQKGEDRTRHCKQPPWRKTRRTPTEEIECVRSAPAQRTQTDYANWEAWEWGHSGHEQYSHCQRTAWQTPETPQTWERYTQIPRSEAGDNQADRSIIHHEQRNGH